jgi:molecular chaperone IbpA
LLKGGCGYENLRSVSHLAFDRRIRPPIEPGRHDKQHYPLYDIERTGEDQYQISLALAGFTPEDVTVTAEQSTLTVAGRKANNRDRDYLHQGIPVRPLRRVFNLSQYVQVKDAKLDNGMLKIVLVREIPEAMKPRRIGSEVAGYDHQKIEQKQAA